MSSSPYESAQLLLRLFELRREPLLREARDWFFRDFNPDTAADVAAVIGGENSGRYRMVVGYWDMAASFVTHGAIRLDMFRDASSEILSAFCKVEPMIEELRAMSGTPEYLRHMEDVALSFPGARERMAALRTQIRGLGAAGWDGDADAPDEE